MHHFKQSNFVSAREQTDMYSVKDQVVLVTGAATGIGAGVTRALIGNGAKHVAILDINTTEGKALESELNLKYGENKVKFIKCDVTSDDLHDAFEVAVDLFGYLDVVINNAGIMNDSPTIYEKEIAINVTAVITGSLKALEMMRKDRNGKGGTIVNISSIVGLIQTPLLPVYSATKSAVLQFSNCLGYVAFLDIDIVSGMSLEEEVNLKYGKGKATFFKCDVTKDDQLTDVFNKVIEEYGSFDLVVNNAGVAVESLEKYKQTIEINFTAVVTSTLKAINLMRKDHGGSGGTIINISSITALAPTIGAAHIYAATKGAVIHFSNRMGMDLLYSRTKVRVLTVCFGATDTDIINKCIGFDDIINKEIDEIVNGLKTLKALQSAAAAARGVVHTYKNGKSASTWLVQNNNISDITNKLRKANELIEDYVGFKF